MKRLLLLALFTISAVLQATPIQTVGVGLKSSLRPYEGAGTKEMIVPLTSLRYKRLYNQGYQVGVDLFQEEEVSFSAYVEPRVGFQVDGSDLDSGYDKIDDRDEQVTSGVKLAFKLTEETYATASYAWGSEGGSLGTLSIYRPIDLTYRFTLIPSITGSYYSKSFTNYYFGVSQEEALKNIKIDEEYSAEDSFSFGAALTGEFAVTEQWTLVGFLGVERFSNEIEDSPIVENATTFTGGMGVRYSFY